MAKKGGDPSVANYQRQNTEDYEELPLKIPVATLKEHLLCPVCMSRINGCCMTTCGHRFCFKCIEEWVDRRHTCPCCNHVLSSSMLIKDTGFDALLKTVREQWAIAEKDYFQTLVQDVCEGTFREEKDRKVESPLQVILQKHLKISLGQHEAYHQHLVADYHKGVAMISQRKNFFAQQVNMEFSHDPNHPERLEKLAQIEEDWSNKKRHLDGEFEKLQKMLASTFDGYLTDHLPPPSTMPLKVKLTVPEKNFSTEVTLKPEDHMEAITKQLRTLMEEQGLVVVEFPKCEDFEIAIISPFAIVEAGEEGAASAMGGEDELSQSMKDFTEMALTHQVLHPDCRPVLEFRIKTGTEIRFKGKIMLDSDVAKMCFANTYNGTPNKTVNYFWCTKCNVKWICEGCAQMCHGEHGSSVVAFIKNHKPTRAHCLCPKKSECKLQN